MSTTSLRSLIGRGLQDCEVIEMAEVYRVDEDGRKVSSVGFFRNRTTAEVFAGAENEAGFYKTKPSLVLVDAMKNIGFVLDNVELATLLNDESEAKRLKKVTLAKLSPAERELLGFPP